jgi:hypothetical protein
MSRDELQRARRRLLERLSQPSSAAGLAALLALLVPELAPHAPTLWTTLRVAHKGLPPQP